MTQIVRAAGRIVAEDPTKLDIPLQGKRSSFFRFLKCAVPEQQRSRMGMSRLESLRVLEGELRCPVAAHRKPGHAPGELCREIALNDGRKLLCDRGFESEP